MQKRQPSEKDKSKKKNEIGNNTKFSKKKKINLWNYND